MILWQSGDESVVRSEEVMKPLSFDIIQIDDARVGPIQVWMDKLGDVRCLSGLGPLAIKISNPPKSTSGFLSSQSLNTFGHKACALVKTAKRIVRKM